ncbi:CehA/McbA family metallohydrolase [Paenibacillus donghaensis]|uniref:Polymerase/histidinol phosphatase N-terminal domain-containing protein n=1 Tax=Paenibacillus donghaensis TaxID=414771 RepID=A0A2Z2KJA4_9BACL|nr:CehA/McbA family metallohydrolase [Paenibacillus donghaensis]ASA22389.1 hypothetical protein B9T62_17305 [Paenibacillus donghaensis]
MRDVTLLCTGRQKYKGNIHAHSVRSDGMYTVEQMIAAYRSKSYDFMCLSDHEIYFHSDEYDTETFIMLDGYEMACNMERDTTGQQYHLHGLLDRSRKVEKPFQHDEEHEKPDYENLDTIQQLIDEMRSKGNLVIMNHPEWSKNREEDLLQLEGYAAIEIYNHQSEIQEAVGYGVSYWDYVLKRGKQVNAIAADDAHGGPTDMAVSEFYGGWIVVEADQLEQQAIIEAIKAGQYYSSNGPMIHELCIKNDRLQVTCSPVRSIRFITFPNNGLAEMDPTGENITEAEYPIQNNEQYVRVECVDASGKVAWSNPIYPKSERNLLEEL